MIVGEQKPIEEIRQSIADYRKVLVLGCGTCVSVCLTGGEKEAATLASTLAMATKMNGKDQVFSYNSAKRQCEEEFLDEIAEELRGANAVLSIACAIGVQAIVERFPEVVVLPGLNTTSLGLPVERGIWRECCVACGDCVLAYTGGICPISRCAKSLLNGPCGGSQGGRCEISPEVPCAWQQIYDRLSQLGSLQSLERIRCPKNWSASNSGGPRKLAIEAVTA